MARPRNFDTDAVLDVVMQTFWANGFERTSITKLVDATGVAPASLYGAFGSKRDMFLASLQQYDSRVAKMVAPLSIGGLDGIKAFFKNFLNIARSMPDRAALGCLMVNTTTEIAGSDADVALKARSYRRVLNDAFREALETAVARGEINGAANRRADQVLLLSMGLSVALRGSASIEELERLVAAIHEQISAWAEER